MALRAVCLLLIGPMVGPGASAEPEMARRVVSMNPSLTRMLVALDAAGSLVGVDEYSARTEPAVRSLPTVGGLFNPGLEAVLAVEPDLVVVVPSIQQRDFRDRLRGLDVEVLELPNITFEQVLQSIETLGARIDREDQARERVAAIRGTWDELSRRAEGRRRRSAVLVLTRDPLYVAGAGSFLDDMLRAAGVTNVAARYPDPYPRVAVEWLIATAPEIIIDSADDPMSATDHWSRWPSIPAVAAGRVVEVPAGIVTLPGPYLDRSLRALAAAIQSVDGDGDRVDRAPFGDARRDARTVEPGATP